MVHHHSNFGGGGGGGFHHHHHHHIHNVGTVYYNSTSSSSNTRTNPTYISTNNRYVTYEALKKPSDLPKGYLYKSLVWAYIIWFLFGGIGLHRLYLDRPGSFLLYFFTGGLLGIGLIYDFFIMKKMVEKYNVDIELKLEDYNAKDRKPTQPTNNQSKPEEKPAQSLPQQPKKQKQQNQKKKETPIEQSASPPPPPKQQENNQQKPKLRDIYPIGQIISNLPQQSEKLEDENTQSIFEQSISNPFDASSTSEQQLPQDQQNNLQLSMEPTERQQLVSFTFDEIIVQPNLPSAPPSQSLELIINNDSNNNNNNYDNNNIEDRNNNSNSLMSISIDPNGTN